MVNSSIQGMAARRVSPAGVRRAVGLAVLVALALTWSPTAAFASNPAKSKPNAFTFTGALVGTLHITAADCEGNVATSTGADFEGIIGKLKGSKAHDWTILIVSPGNGTYKLPHAPGVYAGFEVSPQPFTESWGHAKGTLTVKGSTGSVNVELTSTNARPIHVKGSWDCSSS